MDVTTSKLITLCYAVFAIVLCTLGYFYYRAQSRSLMTPEVDFADNATAGRVAAAPGSKAVSRRLRFEIERQQQRIDELQALLDKREGILKLQASRLKNTSEEYQKLEEKADEYLDLLFDVIQTSAFRVNNLAVLGERSSSRPVAGEEDNDATTVDTLQVALEASQWELDQSLQSIAALEVTAANAERRYNGLQQAIIELGEISVPTLIGLLGDQDPAVRAWAATALGQMGMAATNAIDALGAASEDPDSQVRAAASYSMQEIMASW